MDIFNQLKDMQINEWVTVSPIEVPKEMSESKNCIQMDDARSAAFYALGEAVKKNCKVALCVEGMYLTNIYTAITEAWFQKANILIVALFDRVNEVKTAWMDRCVGKVITCMEDELDLYRNEVKTAVNNGIVLLNVVVKRETKELVDYNNILENLSQVCEKNQKVFCYNAETIKEDIDLNVQKIDIRNKYGIFSKYIGSVAAGSKGILCCTADCILVDVNIFRTRYNSDDIKIIILDENNIIGSKNIDKWIESNGFRCIYAYVDDKEVYKKLVDSKKSTILILK